MPTTPFTAEHEMLRASVRGVVDGELAALAAQAETGARVQRGAVAALTPLGLSDIGDPVADVVVAEELGRLRSGGLCAVLLASLFAADVGTDLVTGPVALAEHGTVTASAGRATGILEMTPGGGVAERCLVPFASLLIRAGEGWVARDVVDAHALRGAAPADLLLDGAAYEHVDIGAMAGARHDLRTAAAAVSGAWQTWRDAHAYAQQRTAFGRPIGRFQVNRHALADTATRLTAAEALVHDAASALSAGKPATTAAARSYAATVALQTSDVCLQLHGGFGYTMDFDVQRAWRDAHALAAVAPGRPTPTPLASQGAPA